MTLKERISEDLKTATRARHAKWLSAIRLLLAAVRQKGIDERISLDDAGVVAVVDKMLKQRRDSMAQFAAAGRSDLLENERFEAEVLTSYLPARLSTAEVEEVVIRAINDSGAAGPGDIGKVMSILRKDLVGQVDMGDVSRRVRLHLTGS